MGSTARCYAEHLLFALENGKGPELWTREKANCYSEKDAMLERDCWYRNRPRYTGFQLATLYKRRQNIELLLIIGATPSLTVEQYLVTGPSAVRDVSILDPKIVTLITSFQLTLQQICFNHIRRSLEKLTKVVVDSLPLPRSVRATLRFEDLELLSHEPAAYQAVS